MEIMTGSQAQPYVPREREDSVLEGTTRTGKGAYTSPIRMHDLCRGWGRVAPLTNTSTNTSIDTSINTDTSI